MIPLYRVAGLRCDEIDKLQWHAFRWNDGVICIGQTKHFTAKASDSTGDVPIEKSLQLYFGVATRRRPARKARAGAVKGHVHEFFMRLSMVELCADCFMAACCNRA